MRNTFNFDYEMAGVERPVDEELMLDTICDPIFDEPEEAPNPGNGKPMSSSLGLRLPMLPPPKRFLLEGSKFYVSDDTIYNFYRKVADRRPQHKDAVDVSSQKVRLHKDKIQLIKASWFFKRDVNVLSERKIGFHMLTYSAKSKGLYHIRSVPSVNGRYHKQVRRISLNRFGIELSHYDTKHTRRWCAALLEMIKKDVPDVRDDCNDRANSVIALIIQHRVGRGIQGLNDTFIDNLGHLSSDNYHRQQTYTENRDNGIIANPGEVDEIERLMRKRKRETVYKFLPVLKETGSVNKAMKILLGEHYSRMLLKIIYAFPIGSIFRGREDKFIANYNEEVPNGIKHMLSECFKQRDYDKTEMLLSQIASMLTAIEYDGSISKEIVINWAKMMRKLDDVIDWHTWKDIYSMSAQLGLRVRPTRFRSIRDIRNLHDEYSRLIGTTNNSMTNVPKHALGFLEADIPDDLGDFVIRQMVCQTDLDLEGDMMSHCVASYGNKCMKGSSIIISIRDKETHKRLYTVEYSGKDCTLIQTQGYDNATPDRDLNRTLFGPLGDALQKVESKKPLSYQMRANFKFQQLNIMYGIDIIEASTLDEKDIEKQLEMINCRLERLVHINTLIDSPKPPSNKELIQLASKIDINAVDDLLYVHRRHTAVPTHRQLEQLLPPTPTTRLNDIAEAPVNDLNLNGNDLLLDDIEEPGPVGHWIPF